MLNADIDRYTRRCSKCGSNQVQCHDIFYNHVWIECCYRGVDIQVSVLEIENFVELVDIFYSSMRNHRSMSFLLNLVKDSAG